MVSTGARFGFWGVLSTLSLACSSDPAPLGDQKGGGPPKVTAGDQALGEPGGPVSDVRAEATAVAHHLAEGTLELTTARSSFTGRLAAVDFDGAPSFYLVFTSPDSEVVNPLTFAMARGPTLLQAQLSTSTVVGATERRPEVAVAERGLSLLFDIEETLLALGGLTQLDAVVAPIPGIVLLRDRDGLYWDVKTRTLLSPETVQARRGELVVANAAESDEAAAIAQEGWAVRRAGDGAPDIAVDTLTTPRGNLDLARAIDATLSTIDPSILRVRALTPVEEELAATRNGPRTELWSTSTENCKSWWFFGWHSSCDHVEVGELAEPEKNQAHMPWQGRGHGMRKCVRGSDTNAYFGCGPAALTSLVWAEWRRGEVFTTLAGLDRTKVSPYLSIDANYKSFSNRIGADMIAAMNTCSFGDDGAMTTPGGFRDGSNIWLSANGNKKRMKMLGGVLGLGTGLDDVASVLHERVGLRSQITAIGFDLGFATSHWSPLHKYRIVRPAGAGRLQVYVQSIDWKDRWYSMGGIKLLSALAWLE